MSAYQELVKKGLMCPAKFYFAEAPTGMMAVSAVEYYKKVCPGQSAIAFCVLISQADHLADIFCKNDIPSAVISAKMNKRERDAVLEDFNSGKIRVLFSVSVIDSPDLVPRATAALLLRPTTSINLLQTQLMTVIRAKWRGCGYSTPEVTILDFVGNITRNGMGVFQ
jgi:superfamily II DNA or RNA helicase